MTETVKDFEHYKHKVVDKVGHVLVPSVLLLSLVYICATSPIPEKKSSKHDKEADPRPMLAEDGLVAESGAMNSYQLNNFSAVVQELMQDNWNVQNIGMDGVIMISGNEFDLLCATLDPTPDDKGDNPFVQYPDVEAIAGQIGVSLPESTFSIWGPNAGLMTGNGVASQVDTAEPVLACPGVEIKNK